MRGGEELGSFERGFQLEDLAAGTAIVALACRAGDGLALRHRIKLCEYCDCVLASLRISRGIVRLKFRAILAVAPRTT